MFRPMIKEDIDMPSIKDFLDENCNINTLFFLNNTAFLRDVGYNTKNDLFLDIY